MPNVSADVVTVSHGHDDHNDFGRVKGTARRDKPYVISAPGEYEVEGIGVFGWGSYHDDSKGEERGKNTIYTILMDEVRVVHLGDLGHGLSQKMVENLGEVDVLLVPVGGVYTIGAKEAKQIMEQLQPGYVVPMHFKTPKHNESVFGELAEVGALFDELGANDVEARDKLSVSENTVPEETEVVLLNF